MQEKIVTPIQLLRIILQRFVTFEVNNSEFTRLLNLPTSGLARARKNYPIPIKRVLSSTQLLYRSALPHVLAGSQRSMAVAITHDLLHFIAQLQTNPALSSQYLSLPAELLAGFTATRTPTDELLFEIHDRAIASWLNQLLHIHWSAPTVSIPPNLLSQSHRMFEIYHAHARCCSRLRHAEQAGLIHLLDGDRPQPWSLGIQSSIAWLDASQQLRLSLATERQLVNQLLAVLDAWAEPTREPGRDYFLQAEAVSRTFQAVQRSCPLFGHLMTEPCDRLHVHLGLLLSTQRVLFQLLDTLGLVVPFEL